jgi:hypothetical protein
VGRDDEPTAVKTPIGRAPSPNRSGLLAHEEPMKEDSMRIRSSLRRRRIVGLALTACSLAIVPPAAASAQADMTTHTDGSASAVQTQDLRSPDARDAALGGAPAARSDLRSPDARDAAVAAATPPARTDLRSPDARDAAFTAASGSPATPPSAVAVQPTVVPVVDHGSQTLAIVLSSTALFLALAAVGFAALYRRPRPRWSAS